MEGSQIQFANDVLELLLKITQLIGIPVVIWVYWKNKKKETEDREYGTYDALDNKFIDYLKMCADNSDLDVAEPPRENMPVLTDEQKHRESIILTVLIAIMERAFLMYKDKSSKLKKAQWIGWNEYIKDWSVRQNFIEILPHVSEQFDVDFVDYLNKMIKMNSTMNSTKWTTKA